MKKYLYPAIFILALFHKAIGLEWFIAVALGFFLVRFSCLAAKGGACCYRCKSAFVASILLIVIGFGVFWPKLFLVSGLLLGLAAFT